MKIRKEKESYPKKIFSGITNAVGSKNQDEMKFYKISYQRALELDSTMDTVLSKNDIEYLLSKYLNHIHNVKIFPTLQSTPNNITKSILGAINKITEEVEVYQSLSKDEIILQPINIISGEINFWSLLMVGERVNSLLPDVSENKNKSLLFIPHSTMNWSSIKEKTTVMPVGPLPVSVFDGLSISVIGIDKYTETNQPVASGHMIIEMATHLIMAKKFPATLDISALKIQHYVDTLTEYEGEKVADLSKRALVFNFGNGRSKLFSVKSEIVSAVINYESLKLRFMLGGLDEENRKTYIDLILKVNKQLSWLDGNIFYVYFNILKDEKNKSELNKEMYSEENNNNNQNGWKERLSKLISVAIAKTVIQHVKAIHNQQITSSLRAFNAEIGLDVNLALELYEAIFKEYNFIYQQKISTGNSLDKLLEDARKKNKEIAHKNEFATRPIILPREASDFRNNIVAPLYNIYKPMLYNELRKDPSIAEVTEIELSQFADSKFGCASINMQDHDGFSLMHEAVIEKAWSIAVCLYEFGINIDLKDNQEHYAYDYVPDKKEKFLEELSSFYGIKEIGTSILTRLEKLSKSLENKNDDESNEKRILYTKLLNLGETQDHFALKCAVLELNQIYKTRFLPDFSVKTESIKKEIKNCYDIFFVVERDKPKKELIQTMQNHQAMKGAMTHCSQVAEKQEATIAQLQFENQHLRNKANQQEFTIDNLQIENQQLRSEVEKHLKTIEFWKAQCAGIQKEYEKKYQPVIESESDNNNASFKQVLQKGTQNSQSETLQSFANSMESNVVPKL